MTTPGPGRVGGGREATLEREEHAPEEPAEPGGSVLASRHKRRDAATRRFLAAGDVLALLLSLVCAFLLTRETRVSAEVAWGLLAVPWWLLVFKLYGLYDRDIKRVSQTTLDDVPWLFHAVIVGCLGIWAYFRLGPVPEMPFADILLLGAVAGVVTLAVRSVVRYLRIRILGPERVLLIGEGAELAELVRKMRSHLEYGLLPVGLVSRSEAKAGAYGIPSFGLLAELNLSQIVAAQAIDRVMLAHTGLTGASLLDLMRRCKQLVVKVSVVPELFAAMGPAVEIDDVEGVTVLGVNPPVLPRSSRAIKRTVDIIGALGLLLISAPVLTLVVIAIKLDSVGPVIFAQTRIGRGRERFRLLKFRTMVVDAESRQEELRAMSRDPNWLLIDHDPRVTRVGRFLRRSSLDEFPQLINVLKGEMSLVGPRPLIESEDALLEWWARSRIDLTPGLTGLWQVLGRTSIPFEEMVKLDYVYVTNWSLWNDIRLMLRTLPAVLLRRGVN